MVRWVVYVARMGEIRDSCQVLIVMHEGKRPIGGLGDSGRRRRRRRRILTYTVRKEAGKLWTGFIWLRIGTNDGLL
jgi:hypothetical protein